ncbi:TVP38/TMEM64 family protein [Serpentinicella alkaliphila]|uniref:Putative membrane protein YdjX (TVP38/TMEM64 family) n=1 Tax=Serpentinicella alkaliphila TaxID=1734049 RepID=A0A4R2SY39_9FIRM|nr:TVP38/TMEM64 family protein [Serpentinicella alkaliphila]QUH24587.1 TVP38/TMEM64 family protein [Serpentinicella alkaliphila]TCP93394.1 putative membrane protein YdjX (TVP38/TMEM64 family) [Serpentinicella alkaliphila]
MAKEVVEQEKKSNTGKLIAVVLLIATGFFIAWKTGVVSKLQDVEAMQAFLKSFGIWGYLVFIFVFIVACVFMLPGSMLTIVGGIAFGPIIGGVVSLIGATFGATAAFLVAKYVARGMIEDKIGQNQMFKKIDDGVEKNGTSFLILTRLVPVFPFSFQNYAYGLTKIDLSTYFIVSLLCMTPGAFIYAYMAGEIVTNGFSAGLLVKFAIAGIILFLISLIPKYIAKKKGIDMNDLK